MTTTNYVDPWSSSAGEPLTGSSAPNSCWRYVTAAEMEKLMGSAQHLKATETLSEYRNRTREAKHALAVKKAAERAATARAGTARAAAKQAERIKQIEENNAQWLKTQKEEGPLISDEEGGLIVLGVAVCCALAAPLTAAGVAFGLLCVGGHFSD